MGVFEDLFVKAKVAVDVIGEKTGLFVDVSKLKIKMAELKAELKKEFESLGKSVHHAKKNGQDNTNAVTIQVEQIDNLLVQIESLKAEIASMKNRIVCKACGNQNEKEASFCSKCGGGLDSAEGGKAQSEDEDDFAEFDD